MAAISPTDAALLEAMMATIGAIWSIGFVAYTFIFEHYRDSYYERISEAKIMLEFLRDYPPGPNQGVSPPPEYWTKEARELVKVILHYEVVFWGYLFGGFAAVASILFSAYVVAIDNLGLVQPAEYLFAGVLVLLGAILSFEVLTSIRRLGEKRGELKALLKSG